MDKRIQGKYILIFLGVMVVIAGSIAALWGFSGFLHETEKKTILCDINHDGIEETISLNHQKISITENENLLWEGQQEWKITDFLIADINEDGWEELLLLLWKKGSFGEYAPFWEENEQDNELSQHIFIYYWSQQRMKPLWMSSRLKPQIKSWNMTEDGKIHIITDQEEDTLWRWAEWGLERVQ